MHTRTLEQLDHASRRQLEVMVTGRHQDCPGQESFAGLSEPGRVHVVVSTVAGERAFLVDDGHRWRKAIDKVRGAH